MRMLPQAAFVPSNLVVGSFNFGGVSKQQQGAGKAFKFTASPAKAKAVLGEKTNRKAGAGSEAAVPVKRPTMGYRPHTGKLKDWNELQREKRMAMAAGPGMAGGGNAKAAERRQQVIKGVRMNKRAELLLKKRQIT